MKYTITWKDWDNKTCVLSLIDTTAEDTNVVELTPAEMPFITQEDGDTNPLAAVRKQTGTITFLTSQNFTINITSGNQWRVVLKVAGVVKWLGWLKGETNNQDYTSAVHEVQLNCVDDLGTLDTWNLDKTKGFGMVKLLEVAKECINHVNGVVGQDDDHQIVMPKDDGTEMWQWTVSRYNFFSTAEEEEDGETKNTFQSQSCLDVLETICKFFGWTLRAVGKTLYFQSVGATEYYTAQPYLVWITGRFVSTSEAVTASTLPTPTEAAHLVSTEPGKKRVTVRASLKYVDSGAFPEIGYNSGKVVNTYNYTPLTETATSYHWLCRELDGIDCVEFTYDKSKNIAQNMNESETKKKAVPVSEDYWDGPSYDPGTHSKDDTTAGKLKANYQFNNRIYCGITGPGQTEDAEYLLKITGKSSAMITGGAIEIKFDRHLWNTDGSSYFAASPVKAGMEKIQMSGSKNLATVRMEWSLKVGDKYWNGSAWTTTASTFNIDSKNEGDHAMVTGPSNKTLAMAWTSTAWCAEVKASDQLSGVVEAKLLRVRVLNGTTVVLPMYPTMVILENLAVGYCDPIDVLKLGEQERKASRTYSSEEMGWQEEMAVEVNMNSYRGDGANYGQLVANNVPVEVMTLADGTKVRPEKHLLSKYVAEYSEARNVLELAVRTTDDIGPAKHCTLGGKEYVGLSYSRMNWRNCHAKVIMREK